MYGFRSKLHDSWFYDHALYFIPFKFVDIQLLEYRIFILYKYFIDSLLRWFAKKLQKLSLIFLIGYLPAYKQATPETAYVIHIRTVDGRYVMYGEFLCPQCKLCPILYIHIMSYTLHVISYTHIQSYTATLGNISYTGL